MKNLKKFFIYLGIFLYFIYFLPDIKANPVIPTPREISVQYLIGSTLLFFGTIGCEYAVGFYMIHKAKENKSEFIKIIFIINAITFPITQLFVYFFALITLPNYLFYVILLIETIVIVLEWGLITLIFKKRNAINYFAENNSKPHLFFYSVIANIITYLTGIGFVFLWGSISFVFFSF